MSDWTFVQAGRSHRSSPIYMTLMRMAVIATALIGVAVVSG